MAVGAPGALAASAGPFGLGDLAGVFAVAAIEEKGRDVQVDVVEGGVEDGGHVGSLQVDGPSVALFEAFADLAVDLGADGFGLLGPDGLEEGFLSGFDAGFDAGADEERVELNALEGIVDDLGHRLDAAQEALAHVAVLEGHGVKVPGVGEDAPALVVPVPVVDAGETSAKAVLAEAKAGRAFCGFGVGGVLEVAHGWGTPAPGIWCFMLIASSSGGECVNRARPLGRLMPAKHVFVSGKVQGVYFRASTKKKAEEVGVSGWVQNLPDGRVEAVFVGDEEDVEAMLAFCQVGSKAARVEEMEVKDILGKGLRGFRIRPTPNL